MNVLSWSGVGWGYLFSGKAALSLSCLSEVTPPVPGKYSHTLLSSEVGPHKGPQVAPAGPQNVRSKLFFEYF